MSLFPAYATDADEKQIISDDSLSCYTEVKYELSECQLLASDDERSREPSEKEQKRDRNVRDRSPLKQQRSDFYIDTKLDPGNLRVSTLYYPGRPEYRARSLGSERVRPKRSRRYFEEPAERGDDEREAAERAAAFRRALADTPSDVQLWITFIQFQERCSGGAAAHRTALEACDAAPRSGVLRELRLDLAARHLPSEQHLTELRDLLAKEPSPSTQLALWSRLLSALARSAAGSQPSLAAAASAAVSACRAPTAYPRLLYVYGSFLRSGGLWEQLTQLLELALSMSLPPVDCFPPPPDPNEADNEEALLVAEEAAINSGMPESAIWSRVERLRAGRRWRASAASAAASADPQRAPPPADLADLLLPVADPDALFLLVVEALRLVKVPLLPAAEWVSRAVDGPSHCALRGAGWAADCGSACLPLLRAARRLPAAARTSPLAMAAYLQPPNYLQHSEFLSWVEALWEAALRWTCGRPRAALLCWRLRWLHALMLALDDKEESGRAELRRLRSQARAALKKYSSGLALPFLQFARLEHRAAGPAAARAVLLTALRRDQNGPVVERLYGARVLRELSGPGSHAAAWALSCAALGRPLPRADLLDAAPPDDLWRAAAAHCEERCAEIESSFSGSEETESPCAALLPSLSEWASARVALVTAARRAELLRALRVSDLAARDDVTPLERRWRESEACALAAAHADVARDLAPLFPDNAFLNLAAACGAPRAWGGAPRSDVAALARALPALLRAPPQDFSEQEAERVYRVTSRASASGAGGGVLALARLEAAARSPRPAPRAALYQALDAAPHCKALHVWGAAWAGDWRALADALLDRGLRLHALPDELQPLAPPPPVLSEPNQI